MICTNKTAGINGKGQRKELRKAFIEMVYKALNKRGFSDEEIPLIVAKTGFLKAMQESPEEQISYGVENSADKIIETALHAAVAENAQKGE